MKIDKLNKDTKVIIELPLKSRNIACLACVNSRNSKDATSVGPDSFTIGKMTSFTTIGLRIKP